jgi:ATP adenylyltransferase
MVVLNKYPYNNGHLLVLPRAHVADLLDLQPDVYANLSELLKESLKIVQQAYRFKGCNIGLNLGATAGAGIPDHLHWHLIPRWLGDTNFFPLIADTKVIAESLDQTFERLRPHFKKIKV